MPNANGKSKSKAAKRPKLSPARHNSHRIHQPRTQDKLPRTSFTEHSLHELNRRHALEPHPVSTPFAGNSACPISNEAVAQFAQNGGPDLTDLRNCLGPQHINPEAHPSCSFSMVTGTEAQRRRSTAYDAAFERHLADHGVYPWSSEYPNGSPPEPSNLHEIIERLSTVRASLAQSGSSASEFSTFRFHTRCALSEGTVMRRVMPMITGHSILSSQNNLPFNNLASITDKRTVTPVPDEYDGVPPRGVPEKIRDDLDEIIVPSKHDSAPIVPNFFLEAKGPSGSPQIVMRQICHDGALGARAIHLLRNYKRDETVFDGKAYTLSAIYLSGANCLQIFAHHVTQSSQDPSQLEYHMTEVGGWQMTGSISSFREGAAAFQNARDLAKEFRDDAVRVAIDNLKNVVSQAVPLHGHHNNNNNEDCHRTKSHDSDDGHVGGEDYKVEEEDDEEDEETSEDDGNEEDYVGEGDEVLDVQPTIRQKQPRRNLKRRRHNIS